MPFGSILRICHQVLAHLSACKTLKGALLCIYKITDTMKTQWGEVLLTTSSHQKNCK